MKYVFINILYTHFLRLSIVAIAVVFMMPLFTPTPAHANYVIHDRSFATQAEMVSYLQEYLRIWRELHGITEPSTQPGRPTPDRPQYSAIRVTTGLARDVSHNSALLQGSFNFDSAREAHFWFEYGTSPLHLDRETVRVPRSAGDRSTRIERWAHGLTHNTTYYYRFVGKDDQGRLTYGAVQSFSTPIDYSIDPATIRVQTLTAGHVGTHHAVLRGTVDLRGEEQAWVWFEYGETTDDLYRTIPAVLWRPGDGSSFTRTLRGLTPQERHYYRIVTQDMQGRRAFGRTQSLTTHRYIEGERPRVTVNRASSLGAHEATLSGTVDMKDHRGGVVFMVYGTRRDYIEEIPKRYSRYTHIREYGDTLQKVVLSSTLNRFGSFDEVVYGLERDTTHYFTVGVAYDDQKDGQKILLGTILSFKTLR
jgi:hypothetical protein